MLEFLLEPSTIALIGTVGGGIAIKTIEAFLTRKYNYDIDMTPTKDFVAVKPAFVEASECIYVEHRKMEQIAVNHGDMKPEECLTCGVKGCANCEPIKQMVRDRYDVMAKGKGQVYTAPSKNVTFVEDKPAPLELEVVAHDYNKKPVPPKGKGGGSKSSNIYLRNKPTEQELFERLKAKDPRLKGYRLQDWQFQEDLKKANAKRIEFERRAEYEAKKKASEDLLREKKKLAEKDRLMVKIDGKRVNVQRPGNVPDFAECEVLYDPLLMTESIFWSWKYEDGQKCYVRQNVTLESYDIVTGNGEVARTNWIAIADPVTGEHLGDYRNVNGKSELRNPVNPEPHISPGDCNCSDCVPYYGPRCAYCMKPKHKYEGTHNYIPLYTEGTIKTKPDATNEVIDDYMEQVDDLNKKIVALSQVAEAKFG